METIQADGSVVSSSQIHFSEIDAYRRINGTMQGVILTVTPSDDPENLSSVSTTTSRGFRHECKVLVYDDDGTNYLLLSNVVIPPKCHSGIDNYEEDLPRGATACVDNQQLDVNWKTFKNVDVTRLDGEHCLVGFIGGNIDKPYIASWWPHPANRFDPATSGQACLAQVDPKKNKSRAIRRVNGVLQVVTKDGDVYFDTTEASSVVKIASEKGLTSGYERQLKDKGGSIQVNIKQNQQLEINWNTPVEGLKAGSTSSSQEREVDLPHIDHAKAIAAATPPKRETSSSFIRFKQQEMFQRTSNYTVSCEEAGDTKGEYVVAASDSINLYVRKGDTPTVTFHIEDGKLQLINSDGSQINILNDEIQIVTKSGGFISVTGNKIALAGQVDVSGPMAVGGVTGQPTILGTTHNSSFSIYAGKEQSFGLDMAKIFTDLAAACTAPPLTPLGAYFTKLANSCTDFAAAALALQTTLPTMLAKNLASS
jgi:hypothetical protein